MSNRQFDALLLAVIGLAIVLAIVVVFGMAMKFERTAETKLSPRQVEFRVK